MRRLNLTLDDDTWKWLDRYARAHGQRRATSARTLLREALERHDAIERKARLARDYAAGRADARAVLDDLEGAQFELLDD